MILNNQWITEEIKEEIKRANKKLPRDKWKWKHDPKPVVCSKGSFKRKVYKFTSGNKKKISIKQPNLIPKATTERTNKTQNQKKKKKSSKIVERKEITMIRQKIIGIETKKTTAKINETKSWFFEKINKIEKPLARLIKKKRERTQINKIRNEKGEATTDITEIQRIIKDYSQTIIHQ